MAAGTVSASYSVESGAARTSVLRFAAGQDHRAWTRPRLTALSRPAWRGETATPLLGVRPISGLTGGQSGGLRVRRVRLDRDKSCAFPGACRRRVDRGGSPAAWLEVHQLVETSLAMGTRGRGAELGVDTAKR